MSARAAIAAMSAYTLELRDAEVKLNQNESPFDAPPEWKAPLLEDILRRPWNVYPDFESTLLREALASAHGLRPSNILVGNGSNELLAAAVSAFVGPGTPVVIPRPAFTLYEKLVTVAGGLVVPVDLRPESGTLPLEGMLAALRTLRDAVVIVCSPNNPTGGVLPEHGLEQLLSTGATVLFDRAYGEFAHDNFPQLDDRLVTFSTFSKAWGLAALRVGWLVSTDATCRQIRKVKLPYSLNIVSETIAAAALREREIVARNVREVVGERERLFRALGGIEGLTPFPSQANFIAFRSERTPCRDVFEALHARGILLRDLSSHPGLGNCLRVSVGSPEQNDRFLAALQEVV